MYSRLYFFVERSDDDGDGDGDGDDAAPPPSIIRFPIPIIPPGVTPATLAAANAPFPIDVNGIPVASLIALAVERPALPIFHKSAGLAFPLIILSDIFANSDAAPAAEDKPFNNFSGSLSALAILSGVMPAACNPALAILNAF